MPYAASLVIQVRDLDLLRELFESRHMSLPQAAAIVFGGKREAAKKRLQRLKAARLIGHRARRPNEPASIYITSRGVSLLINRGVLSDHDAIRAAMARRALISPLTVRHEHQVMDIKAAFYAAVQKSQTISIEKFITWPKFCAFKTCDTRGRRFILRPDGLFTLKESTENGEINHDFYLEIDRSTESLATLITKAESYLGYYRSGGFAKSRGVSAARYKTCPFRVLIVVQSEDRCTNVLKRMLSNKPVIRTLVNVSTLQEVIQNPFGAIWRRPVDSESAPAVSLIHSN